MTQAHGRQACRNKSHNSSCVKVFGYPSSLQRHQRTHSEDKHHEYKHYWKVFRECGYVQIHGRTHSGKKLYRWKQSLIFFYSLRSTQRHGETHRGMEHYVSKQWRKTCCVLSSCRRYQNCTVHRKTTYVYNWGKASVLSSTMREPAMKTKPSVILASFLDRTEITSLCVQVISPYDLLLFLPEHFSIQRNSDWSKSLWPLFEWYAKAYSSLRFPRNLETTHTTKKAYLHEWCMEVFSSLSSFHKHEATHLGQ